MEQIIEIKDYSAKESEYSSVAGFKVLTTEQSIRLFIDNDSSCCESWGWFWCNDNPQDFIGAGVIGISVTDSALNEAIMKKNELDTSEKYFEGGVMFVNIETDRGVLQFVAYNQHNGYYSHEAKVISKQLNYESNL